MVPSWAQAVVVDMRSSDGAIYERIVVYNAALGFYNGYRDGGLCLAEG